MARRSENTDALKEEVARRIKRLRTNKGWRGAELARQTALHMPDMKFGRSVISKYENAEILPSLISTHAMAKALGVEPDQILPSATALIDETMNVEAHVRAVDTDTVHVRVNQRLPAALGYKIIMLIKEYEAEARGKK